MKKNKKKLEKRNSKFIKQKKNWFDPNLHLSTHKKN